MANEKTKEEPSALGFEKPIEELDEKIGDLISLMERTGLDLEDQIKVLKSQRDSLWGDTFNNLSAWDKVQIARHVDRPQTTDYIEHTFDDFLELCGDRVMDDNRSIRSGFATIGEHKVLLIGQQKGKDVRERHLCHSGSTMPEGYRKALRKMKMAERFGLPIITLIDTPGAYPGVDAEMRGQSIAIAENLLAMARLRVPIICVVIGEGSSGGALGIGVGDKSLILENSYYSVISPEGCASILWHTRERAAEAAETLCITSDALYRLNLVDEIITEPGGGAHRDLETAGENLKKALIKNLDDLVNIPLDELVETRYKKLRDYGAFVEDGVAHHQLRSGETPDEACVLPVYEPEPEPEIVEEAEVEAEKVEEETAAEDTVEEKEEETITDDTADDTVETEEQEEEK